MLNDWRAAAQELIAMRELDQQVRSRLAADGSLFRDYHPEMRAVHDANARRLAAILDSHGWPGVSQVGPEAAEAAWLIAQHAIAQPELQRRVLAELEAAARRGDAPLVHVALLADRIRSLEGRPQRYGTQFDWDATGEMSPLPVENVEALDRLRLEVGLGPMSEAVQDQREAVARSGERPPVDWAQRQRQMEAWCREVGWRE